MSMGVEVRGVRGVDGVVREERLEGAAGVEGEAVDWVIVVWVIGSSGWEGWKAGAVDGFCGLERRNRWRCSPAGGGGQLMAREKQELAG